MSNKKTIGALCLGLLGTSLVVFGAVNDTPIADAAMKGDKQTVRSLIKQAVDVNSAQGDGMTALHWAALNGDAEMARMLLYAGANIKAATRLGGYTPLFMASERGHAAVITELLKNGADANARALTGLTPLMMAAMSGDPQSVRLLLEHAADPNAKESEHEQTALSFAAAFNRADVIELLLQTGANPNLGSKLLPPATAPPRAEGGQGGGQAVAQPAAQPARSGQPPVAAATGGAAVQGGSQAATAGSPASSSQAPATAGGQAAPPNTQSAQNNNNANADGGERGGRNPRGGLTPLMYAARQGGFEATRNLLDGGADINAKSGDNSTALLLATINGHFDLAKYLVDRGADVNIASLDGTTPLYGVVNTQWARKSFYPQPTTKYEKIGYLDLTKLLLDHGANPNARLVKELWYTEYSFSLHSANAEGSTAFWKCAEVGDLEGMRLLVSRGADPNIASKDGVTPLLIAAGAGVHGNTDVTVATGRLAAVKYLVEELNADVNTADTGGNNRLYQEVFQQAGAGTGATQAAATQANAAGPTNTAAAAPGQQQQQQQQQQQAPASNGGFTALHHAAGRGDNEMILYLVSRGARADVVSQNGVTVADMANGPRQRIQPYPETVALLEILGSKNSRKCVSC